jgi:TolB protein
MKLNSAFSLACLALAIHINSPAAEDEDITIRDWVGGPERPIPISMAGFTGQVQSILKFDLEVAGFEIVEPETAQFNITGSNNGQVEGTVVDRISKATKLPRRAYTGGTPRTQTHALADDIVKAITGRAGIAKTKIAFKVESSQGKSEIYVSDYDGANAIAVTKDDSMAVAPAWVPAKRWLFYTSYKSSWPDIYSHDLNTGERKVVARYSGLNTSPAISPDGRFLAMILSKSGSPDVYVANLDGTGLRQLTKTREDESSPCWSADGKNVCFVSRAGGRPALYVVSADGGAMRQIKTIGAGSVTEPEWSPNGKWIVFTVLRREFEICLVPAEGGEARTLAAGEDASWAPNSRTIIFARRVGNKRVLSLLDAPTKRVKDVKLNLGSASQPSWAK